MTEPITRNLRDGVLSMIDGAPTTVEVLLDSGDLQITQKRETKLILDRGTKSHRRSGDDQLVDVAFTCKFTRFLKHSAGSITPYEFIKRTGAGAALVTTNEDGGDVHTCDLRFVIAPPTSSEPAEIIDLTQLDWSEIDFKEGDDNNEISFKGQAWAVAVEASSTAGA